MDIKYLTQLKDNPVIYRFRNEPMTIAEINQLESKYNQGKEFPRAIREFLFLAGNFNNFGFDLIDGIEYIQECARKELEDSGSKIDRPFFAFDQLTRCEYFVFVYLDEEVENPKTYVCSPYYRSDNEEFIKHNGWDFTGLVNESIRRKKNKISF